ncbi:MAG: hypothetical protein IJ160_00790 [Muribaculaceae bacterium]|nr:hypothetical protein [Muribaculaceae bacterium]
MMTVANPIYDIVFKYLMEDTRVARIILSALLKKDVIDIKLRPHEYSNTERDSLSVFRIDFAATIRDEDGHESLILIEVQKTWLETETLRFRQYLGVQYSNKGNINDQGYAMPMVAVYLLGHRVGDIEEPVLYVNHQSYNYDGQVVTEGLPDPFIDSLNHDSIIVQIPLLRGQLNNRLDKVLSIFDQSNRAADDAHTLIIDEKAYPDDDDMSHILRRLTMAAADSKVRREMNIEDEILSLVEKRESELMKTRHELEVTVTQLNDTTAQLSATIRMLLDLGKSPEEIATYLGMDLTDVHRLSSK